MNTSKIIVFSIAVLMISSVAAFGSGGLERDEEFLDEMSDIQIYTDENMGLSIEKTQSINSDVYLISERSSGWTRRIEKFNLVSKISMESLNDFPSLNQLTVRDPIYIDGNSDFADQAAEEGWPGTGTEMQPWIIAGYEIDATVYEQAIYIGNVDDHFVISNCLLYNATDNFYPPYNWPAGIHLNNTKNGMIQDNVIHSSGVGIFITGESENILENNEKIANFLGMMTFETEGNEVIGNTYSDNFFAAIGLWDTEELSITGNSMYDNGIIILGDSVGFWNTHDIDTSNTVNDNPVYYWKDQNSGSPPLGAGQVILANCTGVTVEGQEDINNIQLGFSSGNTIEKNYIFNGIFGIDLFSSSGNIIDGNEIGNHFEGGIRLMFESNNNTIINNGVSNNSLGIYIEDFSIGNEISHNVVNGNLDEGIMMSYNSDHNYVHENEVYENTWGIAIGDSSHNIVSNNSVFNNLELGIEMYYGASYNDIIYNNVSGADHGIHLWQASENSIEHNTITNFRENGINIGMSDNNTIHNNDISNSDNSGFHMWDSHGNDILHNLISDSHMNGIGIFDSTDNLLDGNFIQNNGDNGISIGNSNFITAQNNDVSYQNMGFNLFQSGNNVLLNNSAMNNHHGFNLHQSYDNTLLENEVKENDHGIHLSDSDNNKLSDNQISYNTFEGINLQNSYHNELINNHISFNNDEGIQINHSDVNLIKNNTLSHQGAGIHIQNSNSNDIISNEVSNSDWHGISIWASSDSLLYDNDIFENDSGIAIEDSNQNYIVYNFISNNDQNGIQLFGSNDNILFHNSFVANSNHAWDEGINIWNNEYPSGGNYWDHHSLPDEFGGWDQNEPGPDGIVDDPYDVPGNVNQDEYPLTEEPVRLEFSLNLSAEPESDGWQFISLTVIPDLTYITEVLDSIEGSYDGLMYYDTHADEWYSYVPSRASHFNNLYTLDQNMGFWIRMNEDTELRVMGRMPTVTSNALLPGWNMVSVPSGTAGNLDLPEEITKIGYFNASQEYNLLYDHDPSTFIFEPGQGYWVYNGAEEHVIWTVEY